jgi:putative transcriptional regulator
MKNRLTTLREKTGWSPAELADFVGVTRATITAIEDGCYDPSLFLAYDIAEALDARVTELFPPVPRRVRLEELAAKPWYVENTRKNHLGSDASPSAQPHRATPSFPFRLCLWFPSPPTRTGLCYQRQTPGFGRAFGLHWHFPLPAGRTRGRSLEDQNQAPRREGRQWSQIHFS